MKKIVIIGGGFGGLAAACLLAKDGHQVTVLEKNDQLGGRAGLLEVTQDRNGQWQELTPGTDTPEATGLSAVQGATEQRTEPYSMYGEGVAEAATPQSSKSARRRPGSAGAKAGASSSFRWDTGPSWYLMPDVFDRFFASLGEKTSDYFELQKLTPSYRVYFKDTGTHVDMTGDLDKDAATFDSIEPGAGDKLRKYLANAATTYDISVNKFLYKNYDSLLDFMSPELVKNAPKIHLTSNMDRYVRKYFKDYRLQQIMQYPLVFLGSSPYNAPALYNLMSHVDFNQGVFYPQGGMYKLVEALVTIGRKHGVDYRTETNVDQIVVQDGHAVGVVANGEHIMADVVISDADIHHTEQHLLEPEYRDHSEAYWDKRVLAPSALLMYLGVDRQYDSLLHHTLMFSQDWRANFGEIFDNPEWPNDPSIYICAPGKTDPTVAPKGMENIFVLVPIAPGLEDTPEMREVYADKVLMTMEQELGLTDLRKHVVYKQLRCVQDFTERYNSYKGTGLGLAHTLFQTALFRPSNKSKKVRDLYYVGANTHPGIGLPVVLISAELARQRITDKG